MRLINARTLTLEEFIGANIPPYAILSHTWEDDEVTFQDICQGRQSAEKKKGFGKIRMTCVKALEDGLAWAWVDTCCIDKSSSSELSEAINSMFRWYRRARICYAYLSDMESLASPSSISLDKCRWFTRGWTLQELIAPREIKFFDQAWTFFGAKSSLIDQLATITRINPEVLAQTQALSEVVVARRMSWAARRETTRIEDQAYCLLGIFDVNMPLLYGEEEKAFRRLQDQIITSIPDMSIFAWSLPRSSQVVTATRTYCGIIADSPRYFDECANFSKVDPQGLLDVSLCSMGIKATLGLLAQFDASRTATRTLLPLYCAEIENCREWGFAVRLRLVGSQGFVREDPWNLISCTGGMLAKSNTCYLLKELPMQVPAAHVTGHAQTPYDVYETRFYGLRFTVGDGLYEDSVFLAPDERFDAEHNMFFLPQSSRKADVCLIKIGRKPYSAPCEAVFVALGWSCLDEGEMQCGLIPFEKHRYEMEQIQGWVEGGLTDAANLSTLLRFYSIPRTGEVELDHPNGRGTISFTRRQVVDKDICRGPFWHVDFFWTAGGGGYSGEASAEIWPDLTHSGLVYTRCAIRQAPRALNF